MKDCKKLKALRNILYKYPRYGWDESSGLSITARMARDINHLKMYTGESTYCPSRRELAWELEALQVALRYITELNLPSETLIKIAREECKRYNKNASKVGRNTPVHPNRARDNKCHDTYLYSADSTRVRFPSQKRSRSTWKRFYTMFPRIAEEDNWNGKTSDRYKGR